MGRTLVVAPAMVLDGGTWTEEVERWSDDPSRFSQVSYTSAVEYWVNPKGKRVARLRQEFDQHWDTLILDEAHYIKNPSADRTKAVLRLTKQSDRVYLASGTPIPNWPHELFTLLQVLHPQEAKPGQRLGSKWRWIGEWFKTAPNQHNEQSTDVLGLLGCTQRCEDRPVSDPCEHYLEFVRANLDGVFLQRFRDEVLTDLPPLTEQVVEVRMTKKQSKVYRSLRSEFAAEVAEGDVVVAWSTAARHVMLDRLTTGLDVMQDLPGTAEAAKLKRLAFDLEGRESPTLVVAHYRASVEAAAAVARSLGKSVSVVHGGTSRADRASAVREFKSGRTDVLVGSIETISEGLTLTAADLVVFLEKSYKPSRNQQALRRIHRLGQERPCLALDYVARLDSGAKTIDVGKRDLLKHKTDQQMRTLTAAQLLAVS